MTQFAINLIGALTLGVGAASVAASAGSAGSVGHQVPPPPVPPPVPGPPTVLHEVSLTPDALKALGLAHLAFGGGGSGGGGGSTITIRYLCCGPFVPYCTSAPNTWWLRLAGPVGPTGISGRCFPPGPANPPSAAEVWDEASAALAPRGAVRPPTRSLVGLPTTLTYTGPTHVAVDVSVAGYGVRAVADANRVRWSDGSKTLIDLRSELTSEQKVTFATAGTRHLQVVATWAGWSASQIPGWAEPFVAELPEVDARAPVIDHPVQGVVAVLG